MRQRRLLLFTLALLLISAGVVAAQSSTNYATHRFGVSGGGSATSAHYTVKSVFGQAATDGVGSPNYKVSGGFLHPLRQDTRVWLPGIFK